MARPGEGDAVDFYTYTKDLRESTINVVGKDGTSQKTYSYTDYGETTEQGENDFYNEVCYGRNLRQDHRSLLPQCPLLQPGKRQLPDPGHLPRKPVEDGDFESVRLLRRKSDQLHGSKWTLDLGRGRSSHGSL